jgi:hypothetical protein
MHKNDVDLDGESVQRQSHRVLTRVTASDNKERSATKVVIK